MSPSPKRDGPLISPQSIACTSTPIAVGPLCFAWPLLYRQVKVFSPKSGMNIVATVRALNQRAAKEKWYHYCGPSLAFSDHSYDHLLDVWRAKAGGRRMPRRSALTPRDLKDILRNIVLAERMERGPSRYRMRLVGTGLTDIVGNATGKMIDEVVSPDLAARWIECCDLVLDGGQPMRFLGRVHLEGREYLDAENLYVPLSNDAGEPIFVMALCRYTPRRTQDEQSWENQIAAMPSAIL